MPALPDRGLIVHLNALQVILDHCDAIGVQAPVRSVADMPIDDTADGEGAEASAPFLAVEDAALFMRAMPALFPGAAQAREQVFGVGVGDSVAVVGYFNRLQSAELIVMKQHVDAVGIGINRVPYQFGDGEDRLVDLGNSLKVVVLDLNFECLTGHCSGVRLPELSQAGATT